ncbi:ABC transporter permease [Algihabitans albus]|uniref:ABC transporter permease n=1 Tax=Algihabitans albus TaxID=2164067 RepID=UPI000E5C8AD9|nr:ABC transporter permease [Algihabitans albus]
MSLPAPRVRSFAAGINSRGLWTLFLRGFTRFLRFATEGIGGTLVSALLFLAVFVFAWSGDSGPVPGVSLPAFVAPGLVAFSLSLNAYGNAAFPLIFDKLEGIIGDMLMAPLTPAELVAGYVLAAAAGGLITGAAVLAAMSLFVALPIADPLLLLAYGLLGSLLFALLGFITGLWAEKWDRYSAVETFLILPLGLLSGTFFAIETLPPLGQQIIQANPVFYLVDGIRGAVIGHSYTSPEWGLAILTALAALFWLIAWRLVVRGYKIRP